MGLFNKKKEAVEMVHHNIETAENLVAQLNANMRASGIDLDQAVSQAGAAVQSGAANDLVAMSQKAARLLTAGIEMPATVRSVVVGEQNMLTGAGLPVTVGLSVQPAAGLAYEASAHQVMVGELVHQLQAGTTVTVKVAPDDPQSLMVWGVTGAAASTAPAPAAAAPTSAENERVARLTKLQSLRAVGAISDAEFEQQKARILAE